MVKSFIPADSRLTFLWEVSRNKVSSTGKRIHSRSEYKCECGNTTIVDTRAVKAGTTKSCGCLRTDKHLKHGHSKDPLYNIWRSMIRRCYNVKARDYENYGAKGVTVCDEWKNDFEAYRKWVIANGWKQGLVVDKDIKALKAGKKPVMYSPEFCSVVTYAANNNVRAMTNKGVYLFVDGELTGHWDTIQEMKKVARCLRA